MTCEICGESYDEHRTGLSFATVRGMMYSGSQDPKDWRQKRRRSVLGFWHELKLQSWKYRHGYCQRVEQWNGLHE